MQVRKALGALAGSLVLFACNSDPPPRSVQYFIDNSIVLEAVLARCNADREATLADPECVNARKAVARLGAEQDDEIRARREAEFERRRAVVRQRQERERARQAARQEAAEAEAANALVRSPTGEPTLPPDSQQPLPPPVSPLPEQDVLSAPQTQPWPQHQQPAPTQTAGESFPPTDPLAAGPHTAPGSWPEQQPAPAYTPEGAFVPTDPVVADPSVATEPIEAPGTSTEPAPPAQSAPLVPPPVETPETGIESEIVRLEEELKKRREEAAQQAETPAGE